MKSVFITATDTGVGKTVLAAALLVAARARGIDAVPMKPVQTGCVRRGQRLVAPDLEFCLKAAGLDPSPQERQWMCPYRFILASSPHLAAARDRVHIEKGVILEKFRRILKKHDAVIVEGAGGVLVPLNERDTMLDLMRAMRLPVLLAARPGLGTINHTLLTLRVLRAAGLTVAGIVLVQTHLGRHALIEQDNAHTIRRLGRVPFVATLPHLPGFARGKPTRAERFKIPGFFETLRQNTRVF